MVASRELGEVVAKNLGTSVTEAATHIRLLREAGILSKSGRGISAAKMTYSDAANLIIAIAASRSVKDGAAMVDLYAPMQARDTPLSGSEPWGLTFGTALSELLEGVATNRERFGGPTGDWIKVSIFGPNPKATIEISQQPHGDPPVLLEYNATQARGEKYQSGDLTYISQFTQVTLGFVGEALTLDSTADRQ